MLDEDVQVLGGIGVQGRCQNTAVAERARTELHAALHPGNDLVVVELRHGAFHDFVGGDQVMEAKLAVFQHLLDVGGGEAGAETQGVHGDALLTTVDAVPGFEHGADRRARIARHGLHEHVLVGGAIFQRGDEQRV